MISYLILFWEKNGKLLQDLTLSLHLSLDAVFAPPLLPWCTRCTLLYSFAHFCSADDSTLFQLMIALFYSWFTFFLQITILPLTDRDTEGDTALRIKQKKKYWTPQQDRHITYWPCEVFTEELYNVHIVFIQLRCTLYISNIVFVVVPEVDIGASHKRHSPPHPSEEPTWS